MHAYDVFLRLLNEAIEKRGLKQKWIAKKLGKSPSWLSRVLKGDIEISLRQAINILEVLQISTLEVIPSVMAGDDQPRSIQDFINAKADEKLGKHSNPDTGYGGAAD